MKGVEENFNGNLAVKDKKPKLRRKDLLDEKQRLLNLKYYYKTENEDDIIINRMINHINTELRIMEEARSKN